MWLAKYCKIQQLTHLYSTYTYVERDIFVFNSNSICDFSCSFSAKIRSKTMQNARYFRWWRWISKLIDLNIHVHAKIKVANSDIQRGDIRFPVFHPQFKTLDPRKSTNKWILKWRPVVCEKFTKHANNFLNFAFLMTLGHNFQPCMYYFKGIFSELKANGIEWDSIKIQRLITSQSIVEKCSEVLAKITNQSNRDKDNKCFKRTIRTREGGPTNVTEITKMTNLVKTRA